MENLGIEVGEASEEIISSGETIISEGERMVDRWKDSRRNNFFKSLMLAEILNYLFY